MTLESRRLGSAPKWVDPCGSSSDPAGADASAEKLTDGQLLRHIVLRAKTALSHAKLFRDDFAERTFKVELAELHESWMEQRYDWLPSRVEIPKGLGEDLDEEFLGSVELEGVLLDAYEYLQKFAVGLEQIAWDQEDQHSEFRGQFAEAEVQLRAVLCEVQVALLEKGIDLRTDVTREVMPAEHRSMSASKTHMNLRDWLIFRDYMNGLEFVVQVFEHLLLKLER